MAAQAFFSSGTAAGITRLEGTRANIYREQGLPQWTLNFTIEGRGKFNGRATSFLSHPGDLVLIKPGVLNDYGTEPELSAWTHLWSVFTPARAWVDALNWKPALPGMLATRVEEPSLRDIVERQFRLLIQFSQAPIGAHDAACLSMLQSLLTLTRQAHRERPEIAVDERIQRSLGYICDHLQDELSLSTLCRVAHLSLSRFAHLFSEQMGLTPMQYVEQQRVQRASELLLMSNHSVSRISEEVGYPDPAHFTRVFRRGRGLSPRAFRKRLVS